MFYLNPIEFFKARFAKAETAETAAAASPPGGPQAAFAIIAIGAALLFIGSLK
jgi:hypothetical protein